MVDSWSNFLKVEIFWAKLALMVTWETYVFCDFHTFPGTHHFHIRSWSGEERPLVRKSFSIFLARTQYASITQFLNHPGHPKHVRGRTGIVRILLL